VHGIVANNRATGQPVLPTPVNPSLRRLSGVGDARRRHRQTWRRRFCHSCTAKARHLVFLTSILGSSGSSALSGVTTTHDRGRRPQETQKQATIRGPASGCDRRPLQEGRNPETVGSGASRGVDSRFRGNDNPWGRSCAQAQLEPVIPVSRNASEQARSNQFGRATRRIVANNLGPGQTVLTSTIRRFPRRASRRRSRSGGEWRISRRPRRCCRRRSASRASICRPPGGCLRGPAR
jgi:hypothetical protein